MTAPEKVSVLPTTSALARLDPQALISRAIESNAGIETLERLFALAKEIRAVQAREAWYAAMAQFQRECPKILKTSEAEIATRSGPGFTYRYAELPDILSAVQPILGRLGLSVSWRAGMPTPGHIVMICRVAHEAGHVEESGEVPMPVGSGEEGRGANPMQRVGIAKTYAKRYSLLDILGISPEDDPDGNTEKPSKLRKNVPYIRRDDAGSMAEGLDEEKAALVRDLEAYWTERRVLDEGSRRNWLKRMFGEMDIRVIDVAQLADAKARGWKEGPPR